MSEYATTEVESTDLEPRDVRALTEVLTVLPNQPEVAGADEMFLVVSESGSEYTVDLRDGSCTCPDAVHRDETCKHQRRCAFATGRCPIPAWADADALDDGLGAHTDATPRVAATDGGIIEAGDGGEIIDDGGDDNESCRPEDCACGAWNDGDRVTMPCFPCYRAGFETPNPEKPAE